LLPEEGDKYSKEIDHLLITEFGIFIIETKDWSGPLTLVDDENICCENRSLNDAGRLRDSPIKQSYFKAMQLFNILGKDYQIERLGVFTNPTTVLGHGDWNDMVRIDDLCGLLEQKKKLYFSQNRPALDVSKARTLILESESFYNKSDAKHLHLLNIDSEYENLWSQRKAIVSIWPFLQNPLLNTFALILIALTLAAYSSDKNAIQNRSTNDEQAENLKSKQDSSSPGTSSTKILINPTGKTDGAWSPPPPILDGYIPHGFVIYNRSTHSDADNATFRDLDHEIRKCYSSGRYKCIYDYANQMLAIEPTALEAWNWKREAINGQNRILGNRNRPSKATGNFKAELSSQSNFPGMVSQNLPPVRYYCPSSHLYYSNNVTSCSESWVEVSAK